MRSSRLVSLLAATLVAASCAGGGSDADVPDPAPAETTSPVDAAPPTDTEVDVAADVTDDYEALLDATEEEDPAAIVQVSLAELAAILGPITGAPQVDPALVPSAAATMALARLDAYQELLTDGQRDEIAALLAELEAEATVVYDTADDPEYDAVLQAAIDSGLTGPDGFAGEGFAGHGFAGHGVAHDHDHETAHDHEMLHTAAGLTGGGLVEQLDEDSVQAVAQAALRYLTSRLGGVRINMTVAVVPPSELRPGELALTTAGVRVSGGSVVPGSDEDRDPERRVCSVKIGDYGQLQTDVSRRRSVIAHEVFHCWQFANVDLSSQRGLMPPFYFEGAATWAGEQYASGSSFGAEWAGAFWDADRFNIRRTAYPAYGYWGQIAQVRGGVDGLWGELPNINRTAVNGLLPAFSASIGGIDDARLAELASSAAGQPGWGAEWTLTGVPSGEWEILPVEQGQLASVFTGSQRLVSYALADVPSGDWYVVEYRADGFTHARWAGGDTFTTTAADTRQFCSDGSCACPGGTSPVPTAQPLPGGSDSIDVALTGVQPPGASVQVTIRSSDELCDPEVTLPPSDTVISGTWYADPLAIEAMFEQASRLGVEEPVDFQYGGGEILLSLSDGAGKLTYTEVTLLSEGDAVLGPNNFTLNGQSTFAYSVANGQLLITNTNFELSVSSTLLGGDPLVLTDEDLGASGVTTFNIAFSGPVLLLTEAEGTQGAVYFPTSWYPA